MKTAANIRNVRNMTGPGYFREPTRQHARNFGHTESISWSLDVTSKDYRSGIMGKSEKYDSDVEEINAGGELVLRETSLANLVMQFAGDTATYTQEAVTDEIVSGLGAQKGDMIRLGFQDISSLALDGLVDGVDYSLDAAAGVIEFLADVGDYNGLFSAPAILADAERQIINILARPEGIVGELTVVQKQARGDRYMLVLPKILIRPNGSFSVSKDGTEDALVNLRFECLADMTQPEDKRYGYLVRLPG